MYENKTKKTPLVSVVLNCHNGQKYLKQALQSVLKQTYLNWELIFWDNASKDNSKKIFYDFKKKNHKKKLRYFHKKKLLSLYKSRNLAINKSNGEFIAFIDSDDEWEVDKLEKQIKLFNNDKVGVVYGNLWIRNETLKKKKKFINYKLPEGFIFSKLIKNYYIGIITAVIRKKILKKDACFNDKFNIIGDFDLFLKLSKKYLFRAIQEPVATYRLHEDNLSNKENYEISELQYWLKINKKILNDKEKKLIKLKINQLIFYKKKLKSNFLKVLLFIINTKQFFNLKNILILILPIFILKKFIWFLK